MFVVMLLLLIVTATATFAIQSTTTEIRSSGYSRQRMQTRYVAEGALVAGMAMIENRPGGLDGLRETLDRSTGDALRGAAGPMRQLAPEEPPMAANVANERIESAQFLPIAGGVQSPVLVTTVGSESLGVGMGFAPDFVIDINDAHTFAGVVAGQRADGLGTLEYISATYTARGMATPPADGYSPAGAAAGPLRRGYHMTVSNARAVGISGPTRRRQ